jgi:HSP20 family protein
MGSGKEKRRLRTMTLVRWEPFRELTALQSEVNRLFSRAGGSDVAERQSWTPSVDVIETEDAIKLKAELAGMDPKDISIEVQDNVLTVSGERRFEDEVKEDKYYRIERRYGSFSRSLNLPMTADEDKIQAKYNDGVLEVTVPKAEIAKPKKIAVAIGGSREKTVEAVATEK